MKIVVRSRHSKSYKKKLIYLANLRKDPVRWQLYKKKRNAAKHASRKRKMEHARKNDPVLFRRLLAKRAEERRKYRETHVDQERERARRYRERNRLKLAERQKLRAKNPEWQAKRRAQEKLRAIRKWEEYRAKVVAEQRIKYEQILIKRRKFPDSYYEWKAGYDKEYRTKNRERFKAYREKYKLTNPEGVRLSLERQRLRRKALGNQHAEKWRIKNPEKYRAIQRSGYLRRRQENGDVLRERGRINYYKRTYGPEYGLYMLARNLKMEALNVTRTQREESEGRSLGHPAETKGTPNPSGSGNGNIDASKGNNARS